MVSPNCQMGQNRQEWKILKTWKKTKPPGFSHPFPNESSVSKCPNQTVHYQRYPHSTNFARLPQIQHKKKGTKNSHLFSPLLWFMAPHLFFQFNPTANAKPVGPLCEDASPGPARCGVVEIRRSIDLWDHLYCFRKHMSRGWCFKK